ncbi:MAG: ABC transporter ATP-binding protein [Thermoprotei archaeon]
MPHLLEVKDLTVRLAGVIVLNGVNLSVEEGEIVGIIGPNGSGKTTLVNTITGLYTPEKGEIYFQGERIDDKDPSYRFRKGIVRSFQNPRLVEGLTVLENVMISKGERESLVDSLLRRWVESDVRTAQEAMNWLKRLGQARIALNLPTAISGGQAKLAEIARAMMVNAKLLILDEPAAGVNPTLAEEIFSTLKRLNKEYGVTMMIIEHRLEFLFKTVDRVVAMARGTVIAEGTPDEIVRNPEVIRSYFGE